jgi:hypothetical protein
MNNILLAVLSVVTINALYALWVYGLFKSWNETVTEEAGKSIDAVKEWKQRD